MLYNLPTGVTIEMTLEQYLSLTDEDIQYMVSRGFGIDVNDPFYNSGVMSSYTYHEEEEEIELKNINEIEIPDISPDDILDEVDWNDILD